MNYELKVVRHNLTPEIRKNIIDLWVKNNIIPEIEAIDRVNHAVCIIIEKSTEKIIGVSTSKINYLSSLNSMYYFYGMFIDINHRGKVFIHKQPWILRTTFEVLKNEDNSNIKGLAAVLENPKISNKYMKKLGWNKAENDISSTRTFFKNFNEIF
jgi:hypothetical protein